MKIFSNIGLALAMALSTCALTVWSVVFEPTARVAAWAFEKLDGGVASLQLQLAQMFNARTSTVSGGVGGLNRESNGYRQSGAEHSRMADTLLC